MADRKSKDVSARQQQDKKKKRTGNGKQIELDVKQQNTPSASREQEELVNWFQTVKFRKKMFGGVDEVDLWKRLEELDHLYEAAIRAERIRCDALIMEQKKISDAQIRKYKQELVRKAANAPAENTVKGEAQK